MKRVKNAITALMTLGLMLGPALSARAGGLLWVGDIYTTTTTAGGIAAVVFLVLGKDGKAETADPDAETTKASLLYLRDNHLQLVQDLATGDGPVLAELAATAGIRDENRARFGRQMQAHAVELIELSSPERLDGHRTLRFIERYLAIAGADEVLAGDLLAVRE